MDTLTHSLAGALIGETTARWLPNRDGALPENARRNLFATLMVVGSNLPDIDFVYSVVTRSKLDYLLQHRGYTHTIVGVLIESLMMVLVCEAWIRRRRLSADLRDRLLILALALLGPLIHIAMDATNTFGVHPFWPFDNHWLYGDSVFILEPLFWAAAAPLLFTLQKPWARAVGVVLLLTAGTWIFSTGMINTVSGTALIGLTIAMTLVGYFLTTRKALVVAMSAWAAVTAVFISAHGVAEEQAHVVLAERFPQATLLDSALSPMPANPLCWEVVSAQVEGNRYALRRAMLSISPALTPAAQCPNRRLNDPITAPLRPLTDLSPASQGLSADSWKWYGELVIPRDQLAQLSRVRCEAAAFMKFARLPWAERIRERWVLGDFRYDREAALGFSEIELAQTERCPALVPPWIPPRRDLLR